MNEDDLNEAINSITWRRIELIKVTPTHYKALMYNETQFGEADLNVEQSDGNVVDPIELAKVMRETYKCDVELDSGLTFPGDDIKSVFLIGDKPWQKPEYVQL